MKIERVHIKHHTWYNLVNHAGKQYTLQTLKDGTERLREGVFERRRSSGGSARCCGGSFNETGTWDFPTRVEALACIESRTEG